MSTRYTDDDVNRAIVEMTEDIKRTNEKMRAKVDFDISEERALDAQIGADDFPRTRSRAEWRDALRNGDPAIQSFNYGAPARRTKADDYTEAFRAWVVGGERRMSDRQRETLRGGYSAFEGETRALGEATGAAGGYLVPTEMQNRIVSKLASYSGIYNSNRATMVISNDGRPLNVPGNDDTANYGEVVAENADVGTITDPVFSQIALPVRTYTSKPLRVSWQFLADSGINGIEGWLSDMLAARVGRRLAQHLITGDPAATPAQPEGLLKNITTGVTTASPTAVTYEELIDMVMSVDAAYQANAAWLASNSFKALVGKIKDTAGHYVWSDARQGIPAELLGYPVVFDANMPAVAATKQVAAFGDLSNYAIRRAPMFMLRLTERYAEFGQVGFLLFARFGAVPLVSGAYKALVMHA